MFGVHYPWPDLIDIYEHVCVYAFFSTYLCPPLLWPWTVATNYIRVARVNEYRCMEFATPRSNMANQIKFCLFVIFKLYCLFNYRMFVCSACNMHHVEFNWNWLWWKLEWDRNGISLCVCVCACGKLPLVIAAGTAIYTIHMYNVNEASVYHLR